MVSTWLKINKKYPFEYRLGNHNVYYKSKRIFIFYYLWYLYSPLTSVFFTRIYCPDIIKSFICVHCSYSYHCGYTTGVLTSFWHLKQNPNWHLISFFVDSLFKVKIGKKSTLLSSSIYGFYTVNVCSFLMLLNCLLLSDLTGLKRWLVAL